MDLRNPVVGILVGGSPAPGINGVISAVTLEAIHQSCTVVGFFDGFKQMKSGISLTMPLEEKDVTRIHREGGSILRTSKLQLVDQKEVDNCLRVLEMNRVRYLVTIGGTMTAFSAMQVCAAAKASKYELSMVHVPKTIFNDLPLPDGARTFGFSTAREVGVELVHNFQMDARTMQRWYVLVCMGQQAGQLTLGIGKGSASTITLIPEDFKDRKGITFASICDILEACVYKRKAMGKEYGNAVISEGLVNLMDKKEVLERWPDFDSAHQDLGRHIVIELQKRFTARRVDCTLVARNIGNECRAAAPNTDDIILTRDLGFGAVRFLMDGGSDAMITMHGASLASIPFAAIMDPKSGVTRVRVVDTSKVFYQVAQSYMFKLQKRDLTDKLQLGKLARVSGLSPDEFVTRFESIAEESTTKYLSALETVTLRGGVIAIGAGTPGLTHAASGATAGTEETKSAAAGAGAGATDLDFRASSSSSSPAAAPSSRSVSSPDPSADALRKELAAPTATAAAGAR